MTDDLTARLERARDREKRARSSVAKLRRRLDGENRRRRTQRLCTIGAAVEAWADSGQMADLGALADLRDWLRSYITRDTDREALAGTRWDVWTREIPDAR